MIKNLPIAGLKITTNKPLNTMNIPKALGSLFKGQYSETVRFKLTKVAPRKNPITTNVIIKSVPLDCAAMTEKYDQQELARMKLRMKRIHKKNSQWMKMENLLIYRFSNFCQFDRYKF